MTVSTGEDGGVPKKDPVRVLIDGESLLKEMDEQTRV